MTCGVCRSLGQTVLKLERQISDINRQVPHKSGSMGNATWTVGELNKARDTLEKNDYKLYTEMQHEQGDHRGRLWTWLVNKERGRNAVVSIGHMNGAPLTTQENILAQFAEFYKTLYAQMGQVYYAGIATILDEAHIAKVDEDTRATLNAPNDESDIRWAIKHMNTGKTPGIDKSGIGWAIKHMNKGKTPGIDGLPDACGSVVGACASQVHGSL
ncbi:hypothetical protein NDU88_002569 [Pleurodeles waltl]|uniref:Uncharacterized protein n=1 Tax=Pleurodeles waltl TaxID=8319 RepID=A0AAV7M3R2_PLEWA|nr:hypothetical protein NDU88_002569 [Pleurodeles waltl]